MTLVLGPVLRHVGDTTALVWVQTDAAAEVEVLGCAARTFEVQGFHYALVPVQGLAPDSAIEYQVHVDGVKVWPEPGSDFPPSVIRTRGPNSADRLRVVFGSCRYPKTGDPKLDDKLGLDALDCYAARLTALPVDERPDALLLLGDQVYADELTPDARRHLAGHRKPGRRPPDEVVTFGEYEGLYRHTWGDPEIRWILSTLPTAMIFDDHDVRDDWNTSQTWKQEMEATSWWHGRIVSALSSYWVYQHLGNLSPQELAGNETWQAIQDMADDDEARDAEPMLRRMAELSDAEPATIRWSFVRHWGDARLIMVDSRAGRVLEEAHRRMLDEDEFAWVEAAMHRAVDEGVEHLILGTSLPWLLPHAIHNLERWNETLNVRHHGHWRGRLAERIRQGADLEHWAAFGHSFERLGAALTAVARGEHGRAPATALVLSGDVHHAYAAELVRPEALEARVHQLTVSPLHNQAPHPIRVGFKIGWSRAARRFSERLARLAKAEPTELQWDKQAGPFFGNQIGELVLEGREARFLLSVAEQGDDALRQVLDMPLSDA